MNCNSISNYCSPNSFHGLRNLTVQNFYGVVNVNSSTNHWSLFSFVSIVDLFSPIPHISANANIKLQFYHTLAILQEIPFSDSVPFIRSIEFRIGHFMKSS